MRTFILSICGLFVWAPLTTTQAQSVRTVTFRIPVEVENIRYLSSVRADCKIQDGTRTGPLNMPNWSNAHTIGKRVTIFLWDERFTACTTEPRTEEAALRCVDTSEEGKSWSNIVEVPVRDYESGGIRVADGAEYKCITEVSYDTEPERAGEATLSDALCAGFYENRFAITARERYQTYTGGDITAANLCIKTAFDASLDVVNVPAQYIRGGECCEEIDTTPPPEPTAPPVVQLPSGALKQTQLAVRPTVKAPLLTAQACANAVQGKIAWDYKGSKQWGQGNIDRLCAGAENSTEPAQCFERVMHGGINWGGGTQWSWANAIDLCEGSTNASATVACFETAINNGTDWRNAINECDAQP
jgi:hypothetical protein